MNDDNNILKNDVDLGGEREGAPISACQAQSEGAGVDLEVHTQASTTGKNGQPYGEKNLEEGGAIAQAPALDCSDGAKFGADGEKDDVNVVESEQNIAEGEIAPRKNSPASKVGDGNVAQKRERRGGAVFAPIAALDRHPFVKALLKKLAESLVSVLPVAAIVLIMCLTPAVDISKAELTAFLVSALFLILGIGLFNMGADLAMTPMGEQVGVGLTKSRNLPLLLAISLVMGVLITIAEPDLSVLAEQVSAVIDRTALIVCVGVGVGLFLLLSVAKIVFKKHLNPLLMFFYLLLFALLALLIERGGGKFAPLIFDSGGVTTGPITVPFIMALGVGVSMTVGGRRAKANSFGLIALCSIGPMIAVLLLSLFIKGDLVYAVPDYSLGGDIASSIGNVIGETCKDVSIALALIVAFFIILQLTVLKLPKRSLVKIIIGIVYTFVGLVIFFTAVHIGFMPVGYKLGAALARFSKPLLAVFSFVVGFVVVLAEPAVHVLKKQVESVTDGSVSKGAMLIALSIGVGLSIGLSILRIIFDFSILYYLIPGYILSIGLSFFVPKLYTAIAFDSGGVASGPLTASFILPFAIGAAAELQGAGSVLDLAFGVVAMVAMTPLITIQLLGFRAIVGKRMKESITLRRIVDADDEQIIEFM